RAGARLACRPSTKHRCGSSRAARSTCLKRSTGASLAPIWNAVATPASAVTALYRPAARGSDKGVPMTTTIREVRCFQVSGPAEILPVEERQLQMLDVYPEFARRPPGSGATRVSGTYVEVRTDDGATG